MTLARASFDNPARTKSQPVEFQSDDPEKHPKQFDDILANDIEGIEHYESLSTVPFEFTPRRQQAPCGTIAIWPRIPGSKNP